jgi:hypothetical protein
MALNCYRYGQNEDGVARNRSVERAFFWNDPSDGTTATTVSENYSLIVAIKNRQTWRESIVEHSTLPQPVWQYILATELRGRGHPTANSNFGDRLNNNVAWRDAVSNVWVDVDETAAGLYETNRDWFLYHNEDGPIIDSATQTGIAVSSVDLANNELVTGSAHGLAAGQPIYVGWASGSITGLTEWKLYWVQSASTTTRVTLAATHNGAAIDLTASTATTVELFRASTYFMDPGATGYRDYFVSQVEDYWTDYDQWDHIFLDNIFRSVGSAAGGIALRANSIVGDTAVKYRRDGVYTAYTNDAYTDAVAGFLAHLQTNLTDVYGTEIWANIVEARNYDGAEKYFPYLQGVMLERWATDFSGDNDYPSLADWNADLELAEAALAAGTKVLCVGLGAEANTALQEFALASYLLIAEPDETWFRYAHSSNYGEHWDFANYDTTLGKPRGARVEVDTDVWFREYELGYVQVNADTHDVTIHHSEPHVVFPTASYYGWCLTCQSQGFIENGEFKDPRATTTVVTVDDATITAGTTLTMTATVDASILTPAGTVEFFADAVSLGTATLNASGVATATDDTLTAATYQITAVYAGDTTHDTSTSAQVQVVVS